jgi:16S rRNA (adenine1518-N6/adenine1519-N6)-dimethyltransferase
MIKAKKSLGQNFLTSTKAVREIVTSGELNKTDTVLEIGPGKGVLTKELLATGAKVIAIEKDDRLIIHLNQEFSAEIKSGRFILIHGDVLDLVEKDVISANLGKLLGNSYKLIANIPYYITGEIIERFHTTPQNPSLMVLLVQKEVAERISAKDGKESILSIAVKMYGNPKMVSIVPRGAFSPSPNVDSAVLCIKDIKHFGTPKSEKEFFDILHASFAHKRKLMLSNIKSLPASLQKKVQKVFENNKLDINTRAEDIAIGTWRAMV